MRAALILLATASLCAACSDEKGNDPQIAAGDEMIACAVGGSPEAKPVCTIDRVRSGDGLMLVVRHPDGAFRRFEVRRDGTGLAPADGAQQAVASLDGATLELAIGVDRYRFPVTIVSHAQTP